MLAKISGEGGVFQGLHITWLDPSGPKGKARIVDPSTGEVMPAKKCRGSKAGGSVGGCGGARSCIHSGPKLT